MKRDTQWKVILDILDMKFVPLKELNQTRNALEAAAQTSEKPWKKYL